MNFWVSESGLVLDPVLPPPLVLFLGLGLLSLTVLLLRRQGDALSRTQRLTLAALRVAGVAGVLILLLQPSRREVIHPPAVDRLVLLGVDTSRSMKQTDADRASRLDAAKRILADSGVVNGEGRVADARTRLFQFSEATTNVTGSVFDLTPQGPTTRIHQSVTEMLASVGAAETASALILVTDGHDFELVSPVRTAAAARTRQTPIYALPLGRQGRVRDVAVRILSFQPYTYVKQRARINASLRVVGCDFEDLQVQLLRQGVPVQSRVVNADESPELAVEFEVTEPETGQFEYEVRVTPLEGEVDSANNAALTYLNVIDQQLQVLVLEGSPYWDTTFLQRSLMRNDKFEVDSLAKYANRKVRPIRKHVETNGLPELQMPKTSEEFAQYDVIVLGRGLETMLDAESLQALESAVRDRGAAVIFARGPAFAGPLSTNELEPVLWSSEKREKVRLQIAGAAAATGPFRALTGESGGVESLPELIAGRTPGEAKPLTATLATASLEGQDSPVPGMVHRRFGAGQVVSVGVEGLWRWGFNAKVEGPNTAFDRFWDQLLLWLLAGRDFLPTKQYSLRPSAANVPKGEKVYFRFGMRQPDPAVTQIPMRVYQDATEVGRVTLTPTGTAGRLSAEFLPTRTGRHRAVAQLPDGTSQEIRFMVFSENLEETEVATDTGLLQRLCEASGGRLLTPAELPNLLKQLRENLPEAAPKTKLTSVWDRAWVFYVIGALLGSEWFLRRRWGLS